MNSSSFLFWTRDYKPYYQVGLVGFGRTWSLCIDIFFTNYSIFQPNWVSKRLLKFKAKYALNPNNLLQLPAKLMIISTKKYWLTIYNILMYSILHWIGIRGFLLSKIKATLILSSLQLDRIAYKAISKVNSMSSLSHPEVMPKLFCKVVYQSAKSHS